MRNALLFALLITPLFAQPQPARVKILTGELPPQPVSGAVATRRLVLENAGKMQTMEFISAVNIGPTVTNSPYSAEAVTESIQTLYDGNRIVQRSSVKQYRDSQGRERREESGPLEVVFINDPVAKVSYTLHPAEKVVDRMPLQGQIHVETLPSAAGLAATGAGVPGPGVFNFLIAAPGLRPSTGAVEEDLGARTIEGVPARGSRTVTTIPAGEIGNDRPIEIVDERWYSPELQLTVLSRHSDPRTGENIYRLINIQRIEQVRSLFEVPRDYTVRDNRFFVKKEE